jgi:predicted nucleic acid-binding protein
MTGPVFVDTNVLVYDRDRRDAGKHDRARAWMTALWRQRGLGVVSTQVLTEFYWTATRKLRPGVEEDVARRYVRSLSAWEVVSVDQPAISDAWVLQDRFELSFWDSLIVATARIGQCRVLLTEDLQDGQDIEGLLVVNPFTHPPEALAASLPR